MVRIGGVNILRKGKEDLISDGAAGLDYFIEICSICVATIESIIFISVSLTRYTFSHFLVIILSVLYLTLLLTACATL